MSTIELTKDKTKQVVLNVKDNKYPFFIELIKNFDFVQVADNQGDAKADVIANLTEGFRQIKQIKAGKLQTRSVENFLSEL
ncbi:hypothetical protein FACS189421_01370 [Bacteroidia bacterium]|nr:hypothetical protein FACS189421_01370 [Bacteroidia bacterium]GHT46069.1 hypothetical protein FACS189440_03300 [Bacteroidia bacterium]